MGGFSQCYSLTVGALCVLPFVNWEFPKDNTRGMTLWVTLRDWGSSLAPGHPYNLQELPWDTMDSFLPTFSDLSRSLEFGM